MLPPNVINGATLKAHFSPDPMSKSGLVARIQESKGIAENQDHGYKRKQKQRKADGVEQCFHCEIVTSNAVTGDSTIASWRPIESAGVQPASKTQHFMG